MPNILILGGTTEASALAEALSLRGDQATLSYAGRVAQPKSQPVPIRIGGFGGAAGLVDYLRKERITHLVDATHPFAARMSGNAVEAAATSGVPLVALTRPAWTAVPGDDWRHVDGVDAAVAALAGPRRTVMLALGRMHIAAFAAQPQHRFLLRFVDAPAAGPELPDHHLVIDRGPFDVAGDAALMRDHAVEVVVCKNAGGTGAQAKLIAARQLGIPVVMIDRPVLPTRAEVHAVHKVLHWVDHAADLGV